MRRINLNERRAQQEPIEVEVGERAFTLPAFLPPAVLVESLRLSSPGASNQGRADAVENLYKALFGETDADQALRLIGVDELLTVLTEAYDLGMGESPASRASSTSNGTSSTPTSDAVTAST